MLQTHHIYTPDKLHGQLGNKALPDFYNIVFWTKVSLSSQSNGRGDLLN